MHTKLDDSRSTRPRGQLVHQQLMIYAGAAVLLAPALSWVLLVPTGIMQALQQRKTGGIHKDPARFHCPVLYGRMQFIACP